MAHGEIPQESTAIGQPSSALSSERLRELVRRYAYGAILTAALLVLWWGVEGPLPLAYVSNGLYVLMLMLILSLEFWIPFPRGGRRGRSARAGSCSRRRRSGRPPPRWSAR